MNAELPNLLYVTLRFWNLMKLKSHANKMDAYILSFFISARNKIASFWMPLFKFNSWIRLPSGYGMIRILIFHVLSNFLGIKIKIRCQFYSLSTKNPGSSTLCEFAYVPNFQVWCHHHSLCVSTASFRLGLPFEKRAALVHLDWFERSPQLTLLPKRSPSDKLWNSQVKETWRRRRAECLFL